MVTMPMRRTQRRIFAGDGPRTRVVIGRAIDARRATVLRTPIEAASGERARYSGANEDGDHCRREGGDS